MRRVAAQSKRSGFPPGGLDGSKWTSELIVPLNGIVVFGTGLPPSLGSKHPRVLHALLVYGWESPRFVLRPLQARPSLISATTCGSGP